MLHSDSPARKGHEKAARADATLTQQPVRGEVSTGPSRCLFQEPNTKNIFFYFVKGHKSFQMAVAQNPSSLEPGCLCPQAF